MTGWTRRWKTLVACLAMAAVLLALDFSLFVELPVAIGQFVQQSPGILVDQAVALGQVVPEQAALLSATESDLGGKWQVGHLLQADVLQQQAQ